VNRYRVLEVNGRGPNGGRATLLLRDDGYRIAVCWLEGGPENVEPLKWLLWAEYKTCDIPAIAEMVADALMVRP
jgi:hypothetical protein